LIDHTTPDRGEHGMCGCVELVQMAEHRCGALVLGVPIHGWNTRGQQITRADEAGVKVFEGTQG